MKASQKLIAELSGVSRGTVDRVLNGKPNVKSETRKKVLEAAKMLGYRPNTAGRSLALSKREYSICIVMPNIPFFDDIKAGINRALSELNDYNISTTYIYTNERSTTEIIKEIDECSCNAFMMAVIDIPEYRQCIQKKADKGIPVITFNTDVSESGRLAFVGQDLYKSGRIAASLMEKMVDRQANLLVVIGNMNYKAHRQRARGFTDTIHKDANVVAVIETEDKYELTYERVRNVLTSGLKIDGIYMATGHIGALLDLVKNIDRKYRLIVNDMYPEVQEALKKDIIDFTIFQNPIEQGYLPVKLLFDYMFYGKKPENEYYYTGNTVIMKEMLYQTGGKNEF